MKNILSDESGQGIVEYVIIFCFVFIIVIAALAMFGQGGVDETDLTNAVKESVEEVKDVIEEVDWEAEIEEAEEMKQEIEHGICCKLCKVDYDAGVYNVVQYNNCLSNCSQ